jgi:hypothetical protein
VNSGRACRPMLCRCVDRRPTTIVETLEARVARSGDEHVPLRVLVIGRLQGAYYVFDVDARTGTLRLPQA